MHISPNEANNLTCVQTSFTARSIRAASVLVCAIAFFVANSAFSQAPSSPPTATPPNRSPRTLAPQQQSSSGPSWAELTPPQQQALAPLAGEWDKLDNFRKRKWLAIGNKYAVMKPDEQQRIQERMRDWIKLTPEQRRIARESYARAKKLDSTEKSERWQQYQQLTDEQKKKLAADAASKKRVATLPSTTHSSGKGKTLPPIKSAPKPVLEQSVTPQAVNQSALQSSAPPVNK